MIGWGLYFVVAAFTSYAAYPIMIKEFKSDYFKMEADDLVFVLFFVLMAGLLWPVTLGVTFFNKFVLTPLLAKVNEEPQKPKVEDEWPVGTQKFWCYGCKDWTYIHFGDLTLSNTSRRRMHIGTCKICGRQVSRILGASQ